MNLRWASAVAGARPANKTFRPEMKKPPVLAHLEVFSIWLHDLDSNQGPND